MSKSRNSLSEKTGVVVFARIITTVVDLAIVIATIKLLSKTDFAIIGYLLMIHEVFRNIATLGFPESVFYYFERVAGSARRGFVLQTVLILLATALISGILVYLISFAIPSLLPDWELIAVVQVQNLVPLMAVVVLFEIPTWPTTNVLLAADKQSQAAWYEMLTSALIFICLVGPLSLGYGLHVAVYGLMAYAIIRFFGSWIWLHRVLPAGKLSDSEIPVKNQIDFSVPLGLSSLVSKLNRYADKFVVSVMLPASAYAEYTIGAQEVPIIRVIPFAVGSVLISRYVVFQIESKKEELLELWYKGIKKVSLMVVPLTFTAIIAAPDLIALLAETDTTDYSNAVLPFQIFNLIVLLRVTNYGSILQAFGDTKGVLYLSMNLVAANIILSIPLTYFYGITGTALGTLIANTYNWVITLRRIGGHMELPAYKVLPFNYYGRVLILSAVASVPVWYIRFIFISEENSTGGLIFIVVIYLALFFIAGTLFGIISSEDRKQFKDWISMKFLVSRNR
jgi:O-antigen/teichoic acid export membrane protein